MSQPPRSKAPEGWGAVLDRLVRSPAISPVAAMSRVGTTFGDRPTVAIIGPTGSGKSRLLNVLLGFSLLPEGTDNTTPIPVILEHGLKLSAQAIAADGKTIAEGSHIAWPERISQKLPHGPEEVMQRLAVDASPAAILENYKSFWGPAFSAGRDGRCVCVRLTVPAAWLPPGLRLVDIPGYEGYFPEDRADLHRLVTSWLATSAHTVFVFERAKLWVAKSLEYLRQQREQRRDVTVLVSRLDDLHPSQNGETRGSPSFPAAVNAFEARVRAFMAEKQVAGIESLPLFLGTCRIDLDRQDTLNRQSLLSQTMAKFFRSLERILSELPHVHRRLIKAQRARQRREQKRWVKSESDRARTNLLQIIEQALAVGQRRFAGKASVRYLQGQAKAVVDDRANQLLNACGTSRENRAMAAFLRSLVAGIAKGVKSVAQDAFESIQRRLVRQIGSTMNGILPKASPDLGKLGLQLDLSQLKGEIAEMLSGIASSHGLITRLGQEHVSWLFRRSESDVKRFARRLERRVVRLLDAQFLKGIWEYLVPIWCQKIGDCLWTGLGPRRRRLRNHDGQAFPGFERLLAERLELASLNGRCITVKTS